MAGYSRGPRKNQDTFIALREGGPVDGLSKLQGAYLGAFVQYVLAQEMAVYVAAMGQGRGVRVRVFNGDDKYEDTLGLSEDWGPIFDSYAKALGGQEAWRARAAEVHRAASQEAPGATKPARG